jgi:hypothetical protein
MGVKGATHLSRENEPDEASRSRCSKSTGGLAPPVGCDPIPGRDRADPRRAIGRDHASWADLPDPRSLTVAARRVPASMRAIHSLGALNVLARSWEGEPWRNPARTEPRPPGIFDGRLSIANWRSDLPGRRHCRLDSGSTWTRWPPYSWGARASPIVKSESGKSVTKSKW